MAEALAGATGNIDGSGGNPWFAAEAGSGAQQLTVSLATATTTSKVASTAFTITNLAVIDGILLYCKKTGGTGTITISLALSGTDQQTCVVNAADLPASSSGAWVFFKLAATVTGDGSANWTVGVKGSVAANASFYSPGSNNWSRLLRTTAAATPGTTDQLWIPKELTGAGASTVRTVYMNLVDSLSGRVTSITNNGGLYRCVSNGHGLATSDVIILEDTIGQTASNVPIQGTTANGKWVVTVIDANTFDLQSSTFAAGWICGGNWGKIPTQYGAIQVCFGGVFQFGPSTGMAASTNYRLPINGAVTVWDSGTYNQGVSGTRVPASSTAIITFLCTSAGQYGIEGKENCIINTYGDNSVTSVSQRVTQDVGGLCDILAAGAVLRREGQTFVGMTGTIRIQATDYTISSVTDADHLTLTTSPSALGGRQYINSATSNILKVTSTTGMAAGDMLCLSAARVTDQTLPNDCEIVQILTVDSSTQLTLVTPCKFYHAGGTIVVNSHGLASACGYLTRNCKIQGITRAFSAYINIVNGTINQSYTEMYQIGCNTGNKNGITLTAGTLLNASITFCAIKDIGSGGGLGAGLVLLSTANASIGAITFSNNVLYNHETGFVITAGVTGTPVFDSNLSVLLTRNSGSNYGWEILDIGSTITNNIVCAGTPVCYRWGETAQSNPVLTNVPMGTISGNEAHCSVYANSFFSGSAFAGIMKDFFQWRNLYNMSWDGMTADLTFDNWTCVSGLFVKTGSGIINAGRFRITNCYVDAGAVQSSLTGGYSQAGAYCFDLAGSGLIVEVLSCQFSPLNPYLVGGLGGILVFLAGVQTYIQDYRFSNCSFGSSPLVFNEPAGGSNSFPLRQPVTNFSRFSFEKYNQIAGQHFTMYPEGTIAIDAVFYDPSASDVKAERVQPTNPNFKVKSGTRRAGVANGQTRTFSCLVRQSVASDVSAIFGTGTIAGGAFGTGAYSGAAPRLMLRNNVAIGIGAGNPPADVVLATLTPITGAITGATNASPISILATSHGLTTGNKVGISGVGGNTAANGNFVVTVVDANNFTLNGSTGNGVYTSGGNFSKWCTLSGTSAAVTDDGVLEAYVDCGNTNGSTPSGYITVDSWTVA